MTFTITCLICKSMLVRKCFLMHTESDGTVRVKMVCNRKTCQQYLHNYHRKEEEV